MTKLAFLVSLCFFTAACGDHKDQSISPEKQDTVSVGKGPLDILKAGNQRFVSGQPVHPHETLERIRELKKGQHPFVAIVSCSDSRIPPELIFDQGLGDIFSIRTAGNVIGDYELASIEYAVEHLGIRTVIVLGHQDCGAVQAYLADTTALKEHNHIRALIDYIRQKEEAQDLPEEDRNNVSIAVYANILQGMQMLRKSMPVLKPLADRKEITIVGGLYNMENGKVVFIED